MKEQLASLIPAWLRWLIPTSKIVRALSCPGGKVIDAASAAGVTVEQWRAVEAVQAGLLIDGVIKQATPRQR